MMDTLWCSLTFERVAYQDLCRCAVACKRWQQSALDPDVWRVLCHQFLQKCYVQNSIKLRLSDERCHPMSILRDCLKDLKRMALTEEELRSFTWNFRFKETAGEAWTSRDPWWNGQPPAKVWFSPGGSVTREPVLEGVRIEWRWGNSTTGEPGSGSEPCTHLKCSVNGRDVPSYLVGRHPAHGGFYMHSCWAIYTAFPMPAKDEDPHMADDALNLSAESQIDEVREYNSGGMTLQISPELAEVLQEAPREQRLQIIRMLLASQASDDDGDDDDD